MTVQDATWLPRLAEAAERSLPTIKRLERADGDAGRTKSERLFRRLWRKAGVELIEGNGGGAGVRMKMRPRYASLGPPETQPASSGLPPTSRLRFNSPCANRKSVSAKCAPVKIDAMARVDAPVKTAFAASHKMARRSGERLIWYVTIGWSNQLAHAVGLPNRLFYCCGLRIALAKPAAQAAQHRYEN